VAAPTSLQYFLQVVLWSELTQADRQFIAAHPHAAMNTVGIDGRTESGEMEAPLVDGCLESASHADKVGT
jgi:hypothetical protein